MDEHVIGSNYIPVQGSQTILERTLVAEYLLSQGYIVSELGRLAPQKARILAQDACQFAALRLAEIESGNNFPWEIRIHISLN